MKNVALIAGNSHPRLAEAIAADLGVKLVDAEVEYFANTEMRPLIRESVRGKDVYLIQSGGYEDKEQGLSTNDFLMETLLLVRTLKRSDACSVTLLMPSFPYARQDKKDNPRGAISARDTADFLETAGIDRIVSFDLHADQIQGFFSVPCDDLHASFLIKQYLDEKYFDKDPDYAEKYVIVSPDESAMKRIRQYANMFGLPLVVLSKERDYSKKNVVEKTVLIGHKKYVEGRTAIVIDDMFDTFGTLNAAVPTLVDKGIKDVITVATHGILSGPALQRITENKHIREVIVSDSIPQEKNLANCKQLSSFTIAPFLAEVIRHLDKGESLSEIYDTFLPSK